MGLSHKSCNYCEFFEREPKDKYYSYCKKDSNNYFEIQAPYAQFCQQFKKDKSIKIIHI